MNPADHVQANEALSSFDRAVRLLIYRQTIQTGRIPLAAETARRLRRSVPEIRGAHRRLAHRHALVLQENSNEILRAAPFWAVPTAFAVEVGKRSYWASCIWDALGIPAMLQKDARILTGCGCCDLPLVLQVRNGALARAHGVIHFAVPARRWYDNIVFT
jgi:alkylmercury lyase